MKTEREYAKQEYSSDGDNQRAFEINQRTNSREPDRNETEIIELHDDSLFLSIAERLQETEGIEEVTLVAVELKPLLDTCLDPECNDRSLKIRNLVRDRFEHFKLEKLRDKIGEIQELMSLEQSIESLQQASWMLASIKKMRRDTVILDGAIRADISGAIEQIKEELEKLSLVIRAV